MDLDALKERMRGAGLGPESLKLADQALQGVRLLPDGGGRTRLGGLPDLPPEAGWPQGPRRPMEFVAQVDLAELRTSGPTLLPERGLLSFFVDQEDWVRLGCRVLFHDLPADAFGRAAAPAGREVRRLFGLLKTREPVRIYREATMGFEAVWTLPDDGHPPGIPEAEADALSRLQAELNEGHRLLGHAHPVQGAMEGECERLTRIPAERWRLLLQVDSDEKNSDMMWGDVGTLYYWITADDLRARRFDRVLALAQCC